MSFPHFRLLTLGNILIAVKISLKSGWQVEAAVNVLILYVGQPKLIENLAEILPLLDKYLTSDSGVGKTKETTLKKLGTFVKQKAKLTDVKSISAGVSVELQHSIIKFLGRLGGLNKMILPKPHETLQTSLNWVIDANIPLKLPFELGQGGKNNIPMVLKVQLEEILPRIIELCYQTSDLQLRVSAAETLHSMIIYMVGLAATNPLRGQAGEKSEFAKYYDKIFPCVIVLATSNDTVCRSLYSKLFYQLIHWFSGMNQVHPDEVSSLIEAIMNGLSPSDDPESDNKIIRDICGKGVEELFKWGVKQSTTKDLVAHVTTGAAPSSVHTLLEQLFVMSFHPNQSKRLGAATVFNRIQRYFVYVCSILVILLF